MTKPNINLIHATWDKVHGKAINYSLNNDFESYSNIIAALFCPGPFYYYIVNFQNRQLQQVSDNIEPITGLSKDNATFNDILNSIHPDDITFVAAAEKALFLYSQDYLAKDDFTHYKVSYCFRAKTANGSYHLFHHQAIVLTLDENNHIEQSLNIHTDIQHIAAQNNHKAYLYDMRNHTENIVLDIDSNLNLKSPQVSFSKREKQIIRMIGKGDTSKIIAEKLFISVDTVKNHRKNILKKAGTKNTIELISKYIGDESIL